MLGMDRIAPSPATLAAMILTAPAWARVGLTVRDHRLRERAATVVAEAIVAELDPERMPDDPRQLALTL